MKRVGLCALAFAVLTALSIHASAEGPCDADLEKFCKGVEAGEGRQIQCLWKKRARLSKACKDQVTKDFDEWKAAANACKADTEKYCKGVPAGEGRIAACLQGRYDALQPACQKTLDKGKAKARSFHEACKGDVTRHCKGVKPGDGRVLACLQKHKNELSDACKAQMERKDD